MTKVKFMLLNLLKQFSCKGQKHSIMRNEKLPFQEEIVNHKDPKFRYAEDI